MGIFPPHNFCLENRKVKSFLMVSFPNQVLTHFALPFSLAILTYDLLFYLNIPKNLQIPNVLS